MRLKLTLRTLHKPALLPINYQYPLSACIYKIIQRADEGYAVFLHDTGYRYENKTFKLFTFSDLFAPCQRVEDRLLLQSEMAELQLAFHMPDAAENFIIGLFKDQRMEVGDTKSRVCFQVQNIEALDTRLSNRAQQELITVCFEPMSALVTGFKNERGHYDYRSPEDADFLQLLFHNWQEKYAAVYGSDQAQTVFEKIEIKVLLGKFPPKSRLVTIKAGTPEQTRIRGFMNFKLALTAPFSALELALNSGLGLYNALGMGCMGVAPGNG